MRYLTLLGLLLLGIACDTGALLDNLPPDTRIFLEKIDRSGQNRLNSVIKLHWSGEDQDGYVVGYEISFDEINWSFVERTDSTFRFDLELGSDTTDIPFYVRAIDNQLLADPEPAFLSIPVKNSPPEAKFDTFNVIPDTVYSIWSVLWTVDDLDGIETLDALSIRANNGSWIELSPNLSFLTFVPESPEQTGTQQAAMYASVAAQLQSEMLDDIIIEGDNRLYLKVRDIAGTESPIDSTSSFFIKAKQSDLLVVDAQSAAIADDVYFPILDAVYPAGYDYFNMQENVPPFWNPTFEFFLKLYDKVFWYSDGAQINNLGEQLYMEVASVPIREYLNDGGKLLLTAKFPPSFTSSETGNQSRVLDFIPMDSLSTVTGQARIPIDSLAVPLGDFALSYDPLVCNTFITGADPFYSTDPNQDIFSAQLVPVGGWSGPSTICTRDISSSGTFHVFVSVELHKLNGDPAALQKFFDQVLNVEFDW